MLIADAHVHLYPCYDMGRALESLVAGLARLGPDHQLAGFLVDQVGGRAFEHLAGGECPSGWESAAAAEKGVLELRGPNGISIMLFEGRQLVTSERIEVLSVAADVVTIEGEESAADTIKMIRAAGGIPVLPWAVGKWLFDRGRLVKSLIDSADPGNLLVVDSRLRPTIWPEPGLLRLARKKRLPVLAGSDPLPFAGQESFLGTYATVLDANIDTSCPVTSLKKSLSCGGLTTRRVGRRCGALELVRSMKALKSVKAQG